MSATPSASYLNCCHHWFFELGLTIHPIHFFKIYIIYFVMI
jgi:hypothetical protein